MASRDYPQGGEGSRGGDAPGPGAYSLGMLGSHGWAPRT
jgi:hypothetical protein